MTVETTNSTISYTGNNSVTTFAYNFLSYSEDHLFIYFDDVEQFVGFTISGIGDDSGGDVTFDVAPGSGIDVRIDRTVPETQLIEYQEYGPFPAKTNERGLDLSVMGNQQIQRDVSRNSSKKMDKQDLATENNIVTFDDEGNSRDSGFSINDIDGFTPIEQPRQAGDNVQTQFNTPADVAASPFEFQVRVDGLRLRGQTDYTTNTVGKIDFVSAPVNFTEIDITWYKPLLGIDNILLDKALINDLSQAYEFDAVELMQASVINFPTGKVLSTGGTRWKFNSISGLVVNGGFATPLNGIFISDFGFLLDGTDESTLVNSMLSGLAAAGLDDSVLIFNKGVIGCKALTFSSEYKLRFDGGRLKSFASGGVVTPQEAEAQSIKILCPIIAEYTQHIFEWTSTNVTNIFQTDAPFLFGKNNAVPNKAPSRVSVVWFGINGVANEIDVHKLNAAAVSVSYGSFAGASSSSFYGPSTLYFPKGAYSTKKDGLITFNMTSGTRLLGEGSGSHMLSVLYHDSGGVPGVNSQVYIYGHWANVTKGAQSYFENIGFHYISGESFETGTTEMQYSVIEVRANLNQIDTKIDNCWFLGTPNKGAVLGWGNKYDQSANKIDTGSDADGLSCSFSVTDTVCDVTHLVARLTDKAHGEINISNAYLYETYLGLCRNYSTNSVSHLTIQIHGGRWIGSARTQSRVEISGDAAVTEHKYSNCDITLGGGLVITDNGQPKHNASYGFSITPDNTTINLGEVYFKGNLFMANPLFNLTGYANEVNADGVKFLGIFTADGATGKNLSIITKLASAQSTNASKLNFNNCMIENFSGLQNLIATDAASCPFDYAYLMGNVLPDATLAMSLGTNLAVATKHAVINNVFSDTVNIIQTP